MDKYIIVTGGLGYIGSHVIVELIENEYKPIIFDNLHNSSIDILSKIYQITKKNVLFENIDISSYDFLTRVSKYSNYNIIGIIHFAALKSVYGSIHNPLLYYKNNLNGLCNILDLMINFNINNLIFSSSATVYSNNNKLPFTEDQIVGQNLLCPYGKTKYFSEEILKDFQIKHKHLKVISLRYFNPVGCHSSYLIGDNPLNKAENLFPIIKDVLEKKRDKLFIYGNDYNTKDGTAERDYIHIEDLSYGHLSALKYLEYKNNGLIDFINLGTGKGTSVLEIINGFKKYCNIEIPYEFSDKREGDLAVSYTNCDKAKKKLNWNTNKNIKDCIISYYKFINNNKKKSNK
jgi:UDP-glucose 4-epimerase